MTQPAVGDERRDELMRRLSAGRPIAGGAAIPVTRRRDGAIPPMTDEQKHIWLDSARAPDAPLYNEPITIHYRGAYDHAVFLRSFDEFLRRHQSFRVSFAGLDDDPVQILHDDLHADFPLVDLTGLAPERREAEALAIARADAMRAFDIERAPLFRGRVIRHGDRDHRLYLVLHHIIFDGVTIYRVLVPELAAIYAAYAAGREHGLAEPRIGYADYAVWQRARAEDETRQRQLAYWVERMDGYSTLRLPVDRSRSLVPSAAGSMTTFTLAPDLVARLRDVGRECGATLYMTLLSALKALLFHYGGNGDIVVGGVTDTRRRPEVQAMTGYCLNVMPLRTRIEARMTFRQLQSNVRATVVGALENSDVPYERIVREIRRRSGADRRDLFNVFFSIEPPVPTFAEHWDLTQMDVAPRTAKYDLYFELDERDDGMAARILYSTELFDAATIDRMIGHWTNILHQAATDPDTAVGAMRPMDDHEAADTQAAGRGRRATVPRTTLPALIRTAAAANATRVAIDHDGFEMTYASLACRVDSIAAALRAAGVVPGDVVALCCGRSPDMVAAALAIMETGAIYLPLDPSFPRARLDAIVADARPTRIVTRADIAPELPDWDVPVLLCDRVPTRDVDGAEAPEPTMAVPSGLAYLLYTSGSTGIPKGVEIEHRSLLNLLLSMRRAPGFAADDVLLAVTTPVFDISLLELFLPLLCGGRTVIAGTDEVNDPAKLAEHIATSGCTVMQATPTTWRALLASGWPGKAGLRILCGGEALPTDLADALLMRGMRLWNMYGPTETTIWSSIREVTDARCIDIGKPIDNTRFVILDERGAPLPVNVPGMLHISGAGLARGYRDAALTAASFARAPLAGGKRLYRTGDLALMRRDGAFECLGRQDGQVKVRGYRVDLGDVEAALNTYPGIRAAAARPFKDASGETALAACVEAEGDAPLDISGINRHLRVVLPTYMVPARYMRVASLPLTANGKIDRNALPLPKDGPDTPAKGSGEPLSGAWETRLAEIWTELLDVPTINADDDFHDLGGHSLLAARMMGRIFETFGRRLPLSILLRAPTLRLLAAAIEEQTPNFAAPRTVVIGNRRPGRTLYWIDAVPNLRPGMFRDMAAALPAGHRMAGLTIDLRRHDELRATGSLSDIAADMAQTLRSDPSARPYWIGGWCNGGVLAYEVACQLMNAGEPVALLAMLDTANPAAYRTRTSRVLRQVQQVRALPVAGRLPFARQTAAGYLDRLRRRYAPVSTAEDDLEALNQRFMRLVNDYQPPAYEGRVALLLPRDGRIDYGPGWQAAITGTLHIRTVDGGHVSILDPPYVEGLAVGLAADFDEAVKPATHAFWQASEAVPERARVGAV